MKTYISKLMVGAAACAVVSIVAAGSAMAAGKPLLLGLTSDASGQFANSGASDRRGMKMAIAEFNAMIRAKTVYPPVTAELII